MFKKKLKRVILYDRNDIKIFLSIAFILLTAQCTIKLIADYDEVTDKSVTELQKSVEKYLVKMERVADIEEGKYERYIEFYDETKISLSALSVRARAIPKNDKTIEQIKELNKNVMILEDMHKKGIKKSEIPIVRDAINRTFTAILKAELAKKRGEQTEEK